MIDLAGLAILAAVGGAAALLLALWTIDRRLAVVVRLNRLAMQPRVVVERVDPGPAGLVATVRNIGTGPALGLHVTLDGTMSQPTVSHLAGSGSFVLVELGIARLLNEACLEVVCHDVLGTELVQQMALHQDGPHIDIAPRPFVRVLQPSSDWKARAAHAARLIGLPTMRLGRPPFTPAVIAVVTLNAVLAALWLWSRQGYTTHVTLEVVGTHYHAVVDGHEIVDGDLRGPTYGGVALAMKGSSSLPTAAGAPRVQSIQVTDIRTGAPLLEDDFGAGPGPWDANQTWTDGRVPEAGGVLTSVGRNWTDYRVDLVLQNPIVVDLFVRLADDGTNIHLNLRPWRDHDTSLVAQQNRAVVDTLRGQTLRLAPLQTTRGLVAVVLRQYPWFLLGSALIGAVFFLLGRYEWVPARARAATWLRPAWPHGVTAVVLAAAAVSGLAYAQTVYLERIPHVPDSTIYLFQAKMFASGVIAAPAPPVPDAFDVFGSYLSPYGGLWLSQYPFGHPLLLAIGQRIGQAWLVAPVVGGLSVVLVFWIGRTIYGSGTGLLAATLLVASPFFQMSNVDFMSHSTGALYLLCAVLGLVLLIRGRSLRGRMTGGAVAGVTLGLLFNTRPLTGAVAVLVVAVFIAANLVRHRSRWPEVLALAAGGGLLLLAYFAYNAYVMGSPLATPYTLSNTASLDNLGFSGHLTPELALSNVYTSLTLLDAVLFAWPAGLALLLVLLPFVLGSSNRWDYLFGGLALGIVVAWFFYIDPFIMYGPRFWYEMVPLLALLCARGFSLGVGRARKLACALGRGRRHEWIVSPVAALAIGSLLVLSFSRWWAPPLPNQPAYVFVPQNVRDLRGFNSTDARILDGVQALGLHRAVVLVVGNCPGWWCFGSVFPQNDPLLQSDIVYARDRGPDTTERLRRLYPDRRFYQATYTLPSVITELPADAPAAGRVPLAYGAPIPDSTPAAAT